MHSMRKKILLLNHQKAKRYSLKYLKIYIIPVSYVTVHSSSYDNESRYYNDSVMRCCKRIFKVGTYASPVEIKMTLINSHTKTLHCNYIVNFYFNINMIIKTYSPSEQYALLIC